MTPLSPLKENFQVSHVGACAGDFLASRFDADVWPGLKALLAAAAQSVAVRARSGQVGDLRSSPADRLIRGALRMVALLARPSITIERDPEPDESRQPPARVASDDSRENVSVASSVVAQRLPIGSLPEPPPVPSFLPADARARGATAPPAHPTVYSLGRSVLYRHAWECACLLAATLSALQSQRADLSRVDSGISRLASLAARALSSLAEFVDAAAVDQALKLYAIRSPLATGPAALAPSSALVA